MPQVISAIVLLERREPVEDAAVGQHRLDPRDQRAHRPVAQHLRSSGVGRHEAPDRRRPLAAERKRKAQAVREDVVVEGLQDHPRSEEHTSELQSLMRISYAVFCLKKKTTKTKTDEPPADNEHIITIIYNASCRTQNSKD